MYLFEIKVPAHMNVLILLKADSYSNNAIHGNWCLSAAVPDTMNLQINNAINLCVNFFDLLTHRHAPVTNFETKLR